MVMQSQDTSGWLYCLQLRLRWVFVVALSELPLEVLLLQAASSWAWWSVSMCGRLLCACVASIASPVCALGVFRRTPRWLSRHSV